MIGAAAVVVALVAVLGAFVMGLALGSWYVGRRVVRDEVARGAREARERNRQASEARERSGWN